MVYKVGNCSGPSERPRELMHRLSLLRLVHRLTWIKWSACVGKSLYRIGAEARSSNCAQEYSLEGTDRRAINGV